MTHIPCVQNGWSGGLALEMRWQIAVNSILKRFAISRVGKAFAHNEIHAQANISSHRALGHYVFQSLVQMTLSIKTSKAGLTKEVDTLSKSRDTRKGELMRISVIVPDLSFIDTFLCVARAAISVEI